MIVNNLLQSFCIDVNTIHKHNKLNGHYSPKIIMR